MEHTFDGRLSCLKIPKGGVSALRLVVAWLQKNLNITLMLSKSKVGEVKICFDTKELLQDMNRTLFPI